MRVQAGDGLELAGYYAAPPGGAARAVLHTHGLAGNFYENRFVDAICDAVVAKGVAFLACNNRGHDHVSDNLRGTGTETTYEPGGVPWDMFEECVHDIGGAAEFLASRGHREIYFEGHSLGTCKTVYYLTERHDPRAAGAILISPPDMFGVAGERAEPTLADVLAEARAAVSENDPERRIEAGRTVPITARSILSSYANPGNTDIFPFRLGADGDYSRYASLEVPILATFGSIDEAVTVPVEDAAELARTMATASRRVEVAVVQGANHMYWGEEDALASLIGAFVEP